MDELVKPTSLISDISSSFEQVYQVLSTLQTKKASLVVLMALVLQFFKLVQLPTNSYTIPPFSLSLDNGVAPTEWKLAIIML